MLSRQPAAGRNRKTVSPLRAHCRSHLRRSRYSARAARYLPYRQYDRFPALKDKIPAEQWQDKRVVWDARVKLLTSQGPGTAIDFGLKIIDLLASREKAHEVASQLVMAAGIYNYYE